MSGELTAELEELQPIAVPEARAYNGQRFAQILHRFTPFPATGQVLEQLQGNDLSRSDGETVVPELRR